MYETHFGLREAPFTLTPNTSFFVGHATHQEALNTLLVAVRSGEGFVKLTGEVGTGKTLLCRTFIDMLEKEEFVTAYIPNPYVGPNTLLLGVADELGIEYPDKVNQHQILKLITKHSVDTYADRKRVVLCLDEAQAMPVETLEALRLLTNLETERRKLIQVVLFGQPELNEKLNDQSIRQLKQRITFSYNLRPMNPDEVEYYVAYRLSVAGYNGPRLFSDRATRILSRASGGVPRLVNILANKALLAAFGEGLHEVTPQHIKLAVQDTESTYNPLVRIKMRLVRFVTAFLGVTLVTIGVSSWIGWL